MWAFAVHVVGSSIKVPSVGCCGFARWTCASFCIKYRCNGRSLSDLVNVTMLKWLTPVVPPVVVWLCRSLCWIPRLFASVECLSDGLLFSLNEWMCPVLLGLRKFGWCESPEIDELSQILHWSRCKGRVFIQLIMDVLLHYHISLNGWFVEL